MKQMVLLELATYKESSGKGIINHVFAISLLLQSYICYKITEEFDHDFDHQPILSKKIPKIIDQFINSRYLLAKVNSVLLIKNL